MLALDMPPTLQSTITIRGQTVVPASIRRAFGLDPSHKLQWLADKDGIRVVPIKPDAIAAFRGSGKTSVADLLAERAIEREIERAKER
jgi:bifunctional DNA-binding transcriptional regulator/antitoxin component of YhaV-PrlF toxin-antitoxin module